MRPVPDATAEITSLLGLVHPTRPTRKLPLSLRKLLPQPLRSLDDLLRFTHDDLIAKTPAARAAEAFQWKVAVSQVDADEVPDYVLERLRRLEGA